MSQPLLQPEPIRFWSRLWEPPDYMLVEAGTGGELLVAKIRLLIVGVIFLIPINDRIFGDPTRLETGVGIVITLLLLVISLGLYLLVRQGLYRPWLRFMTSAFDVTMVSGALAAFLAFGAPHTAVNSKVVFDGYFIAIGGTTLRYDPRVCILAGLLAMTEYGAVVLYADTHWDLNSPVYAPFDYGTFSWGDQISRLTLMLAASMLSTAVVLRVQGLRRLSSSDRLTGLFNRGYFDEKIETEVSRARRYERPLCVAMLDVDHFKRFNDTHGHAAGDAALRLIATALRRSFRRSDVVARYGGEEFVIVMPETDIEMAVKKIEIIRRLIAQSPIKFVSKEVAARLTISAGVACFPHDGTTEDVLLRMADERLFQAKKAGRNRVVGGSE